jgi:Lrp/AsnC family transcriptional regulator
MSAGILDRFDLRLLSAVQEDATRTTTELAQIVGLSQAPCWRRLQRLRTEGYILREVAIANPDKLGLALEVFAHVKLTANGRSNVTQFTDAISPHPEVLECHVLLGPVDCLLRIVVQNMKDYEEFFFKHLAPLPGVQEINSMVTLSVAKSTTALPLHRAC